MMNEHRTNLAWWDEEEPHRVAVQALDQIREASSYHTEMLLRHVRMYGNMEIAGLSSQSYYRPSSTSTMSINVIKACVDTAVNQLARVRPRPRFLTSGGNRSLQRKAKLLERFVDGAMYTAQMHDKAPMAALDAGVTGTGALKVYRNGQDICIDRAFVADIWVDPAESRVSRPRSMYHTFPVDRKVLMGMYPGHEHDLITCDPVDDSDQFYGEVSPQSYSPDQVRVVEAWHLGTRGEPGRHIICVENATLLDEKWEKEDFPFVFMHWTPRMLGFWGQGIAEEITGIQVELNRTVRRAQTAINRFGVPWVLVEQGSKIQKAHMNTQIGAVVPYSGTPPIVRPNQTVSPEVFNHINWLYQKGFEQAGVAFGMAQGEKPAGVTSGVAVREAVEIQAGRFALKSRAYENLYLGVAKKIVELGKEIYQEDKSFSVVLPRDKHTIDQVDWKDVDMKADAYILKVFPSSSLPVSPSGRLDMIIEMMNVGLIDPKTAKGLLDFEDLEAELALDKAATDNIDRMIEKILDDGETMVPEPFMDLQLFIKRAQAAYNRAQDHEDVPPDRLRLLRQAMQAARSMQKAAMAEQQALAAPPDAGAPLPTGPAGVPPTAPTGNEGALPQ